MPQLKKEDLTPVAGTTLLVPNNRAFNSFPKSKITNTTLLRTIAPYHVCGTKYTLPQILAGSFQTCTTPKYLDQYVGGAKSIYIFRSRGTVQFGPKANTPAGERLTAKAFYTGSLFTALGVDKVMKPAGAAW